ncbi:MAG: nicotinate phosphoribosyltransferase [Ignavibacteriales bacterium]|nr:nicotinate phosphoribosyltransferase [Ignavibacteriales bacterium]
MKVFTSHAALYTDYYQLTMAQGYYLTGHHQVRACFDYFYRENPFQGGYVVFAGLSDLLEILESLRFEKEELSYLATQGLRPEFIAYLNNFRFTGTIHSVREGEVVFPMEPLVRVEGNLIETQIIETLLLNFLNFESLIATKASRIRFAAGDRRVVDFGLRRAQGLGGIHASKAAIIGGVDATSNVYTAYHYGLPVTGTQAHSWIQSFDDELTAFRKFAELYPDRTVLLVDTYNTLHSGVPNAIKVAKELETKGYRLRAIRLDSGDLAYLSKHARAMLDDAGLGYVKLVASNQLDEYLIRSLIQQGAPIDSFGVGTRLVTGNDSSALDGIYKMSMCADKSRMKFSENYTKTTLPGIKQMLRYSDGGRMMADAIVASDERSTDVIYHPFFHDQKSLLKGFTPEPLYIKVMEGGKGLLKLPTPQESAAYVRERLQCLSEEHKRFEFPHKYKVGISQKLLDLRHQLYDEIQSKLF